MLPHVNEISRVFHASFHKALTWSLWTEWRISCPIKRMHSTRNGMERCFVMRDDLETFAQFVVLHVIFCGEYDGALKYSFAFFLSFTLTMNIETSHCKHSSSPYWFWRDPLKKQFRCNRWGTEFIHFSLCKNAFYCLTKVKRSYRSYSYITVSRSMCISHTQHTHYLLCFCELSGPPVIWSGSFLFRWTAQFFFLNQLSLKFDFCVKIDENKSFCWSNTGNMLRSTYRPN